MTTQTAVIAAASGKTLTAKLFTIAAPDTVAYTADSVTERTNAKGEYVATFGEASVITGDHVLILLDGTRAAARGYRTFAGVDNEVATETPVPVNVTQISSDSAAADTLELFAEALDQATGQIDSGTVANNTLTAAALAADAVAEIAAAISTTVTVLPAVGIVADRSPGVTLTPVVGETISQSITLYQTDGTTPVDLSGKTLAIIFETMNYTDVATVADADITVSGTDDNVVTFAYPSTVTASERVLRFALRDAAAPLTMYLQGICSVVKAPQVDVP